MLSNKRLWVIGLSVMACVLGILFGQHVMRNKAIDLSQFHGTLVTPARTVPAFAMMGIDGKPFNQDSLQGHWTWMFFGFTNCGSICPTTMHMLAKTYQALQAKRIAFLPQVVMITVDPARDSIEKLGTYVHAFQSQFYGARGDEKSTAHIAHALGIAYAKINAKRAASTDNIEHSGALILFNPQGQVNAFFTPPHHVEHLVSDYLLLTHQGNSHS